MLQTNQFFWGAFISRLLGPVPRNQWPFVPTTVNAAYLFNLNSIALPLGFLEEPMYSLKRPRALNYGGLGFSIGHEINHGYLKKKERKKNNLWSL
jgi:predicted metalloendopeptidase